MDNLQLPVVALAAISFICILLDYFLIGAGTFGLITYVPVAITVGLGAILVVGGIINAFKKK